jgi:hypothetical protein
MVEIIRGWCGEVEMIVDTGDGSKHRGTATKDVGSRVVVVRTEPTAIIRSVSAGICEQHIVSERDNVETSIRWDPRRSKGMIAEKLSCISRKQAHHRTLFIYVLTIGSNPLRCVDDH